MKTLIFAKGKLSASRIEFGVRLKKVANKNGKFRIVTHSTQGSESNRKEALKTCESKTRSTT